MSFTQVFGGNTIYPAEPDYLALALTENITLAWPIEQAINGDVLAKIIDVTPDAPGRSIILPDARQGSTGYVSTFYNAGGDTFTVKDSIGGTVLTVASGEAWNVYLRANATAAGLWRIFQMGAGASSANAAALAGAGLRAISTTLNEAMLTVLQPVNYAIVEADLASVQVWTGGIGGFTLPDASTLDAEWFVWVKNNGTGSLTLTPAAGTIDGSGSLILATLESCAIVSDGTNYYTVGLGQEVNSVFDFVSINVAGTGNFTLVGAQLNRISYKFTGVLTGNRSIIVPASVQQYWVDNETTGAFTLTVKAAGGVDPGVQVAQNTRAILYCDGSNIVNADDSSSISFPITPTQGGTGLAAYVQGDIIYASAANVLSALAKDANPTRYLSNTGASNVPAWAQVNLTNGVTGVLPAANGGAALSGATVTRATSQGVVDAVLTAILWNSETLDVGSWHDNAVNNTRLTVPAGISNARFTTAITIQLATANVPYIISVSIFKNGGSLQQAHGDYPTLTGSVGNALVTLAVDTGWVSVVPGDYFEVWVNVDGAGAGGTVRAVFFSNFTAQGLA